MAIKVFYSRVPGSTYYDKQGNAHSFMGNPASLELDDAKPEDAAVIVELDSVVSSSRGVMIFSDVNTAPDMAAAIDAQNAAVAAVKAGAAAAKVAAK